MNHNEIMQLNVVFRFLNQYERLTSLRSLNFFKLNNCFSKNLILILFALFSSPKSIAQDVSTNQKAQETATELLFLIPHDFQGILYNCEPLCIFLSLKEDQTWNPPLDKIPINLKNPRWVFKKDPMYPLLIEQSPISNFVQKRNTKKEEKESGAELTPRPPPAPFGFGYSLVLGAMQNKMVIESNSTPIEKMSPEKSLSSAKVTLGLMKGSPFLIYQQWIQLQLLYIMNTTAVSKNKAQADFSNNQNEIIFNAFSMKDQFKIGSRFIKLKSNFISSENVLSNYSFTEDWTLIGLGFIWNRLMLYVDYGLSVKISEQQSFRENIDKPQYTRITVDWCSRSFQLMDINFGLCAGFNSVNTENTASIPATFNSNIKNTIKRNEQQISFGLRFGDDFFK